MEEVQRNEIFFIWRFFQVFRFFQILSYGDKLYFGIGFQFYIDVSGEGGIGNILESCVLNFKGQRF